MSIRIMLLNRVAETPFWVDKEQMKSFMEEYERSSNKVQLLSDRQERLADIRKVCWQLSSLSRFSELPQHARQCEKWQRCIGAALQQERDRRLALSL